MIVWLNSQVGDSIRDRVARSANRASQLCLDDESVLNCGERRNEPRLLVILRTTQEIDQLDVHSILPVVRESQEFVACLGIVAENPAQPKKAETAVRIEPLVKQALANAGERFTLRFKVLDAKTGTPKTNLPDVMVLAFLAPGIWQQREVAKPAADGVYEMNFVPPQAGVYYIFFQSPSLGLEYNQSTPLTLQVVKP